MSSSQHRNNGFITTAIKDSSQHRNNRLITPKGRRGREREREREGERERERDVDTHTPVYWTCVEKMFV